MICYIPECQVVWDLSSLPPLYQTLHTGSSQRWIVKFMMIWYYTMHCKIWIYTNYCKGPAVAQPDETVEKGQFFYQPKPHSCSCQNLI